MSDSFWLQSTFTNVILVSNVGYCVWICAAGDDGGVIRLSSVADCLSGSLWHCGNGQLSTAGARWQPNTVWHILNYKYSCISVFTIPEYNVSGKNKIIIQYKPTVYKVTEPPPLCHKTHLSWKAVSLVNLVWFLYLMYVHLLGQSDNFLFLLLASLSPAVRLCPI